MNNHLSNLIPKNAALLARAASGCMVQLRQF